MNPFQDPYGSDQNPFILSDEPEPEATRIEHPSARRLSANNLAKEQELRAREAKLAEREARLNERERAISQANAPNWPKLPFVKPFVYHDIENDIPSQGRWLVKRLYYAWMFSTATYIINFAACLALMISKADSAGTNFGLAVVIMLVGTPVSFQFWYQAIYNGVKHDRSISFFLFYFNFGFHLAFSGLLGVGIPGWGGAGVIYTLSMIGSNLGTAVMCIIATTCLGLEVLYGVWQFKAVVSYYRSKGLTADQAKAQAIEGVAKSKVGKELMTQAIKNAAK